MRSKKPMWFWAGSTIKESEIKDISAYNRENSIMWFVFSLLMWICIIVGYMNMKMGGIILIVSSIIGIPILMIVYRKIYQ